MAAKPLIELTYVELLVYVIVSAILAQFWLMAFQNFTFGTLGLSDTSWYVAFVLSFMMFILILIVISNYRDIIKGFGIGLRQ